MNKEMSQIILRAAEAIQTGSQQFTCHAVDAGGGTMNHSIHKHSDAREFYEHLMTPSIALKSKIKLEPYHFGDRQRPDHKKPEVRGFRVLALCMASAVAAAGGL